MPPVHLFASTSILRLFDKLLFARESFVNSTVGQLLGELYIAALLLVTFLLFTYWLQCAYCIAMAETLELTALDLEPIRWHKRFRDHIWQLLVSHRLLVP